MRSGPFMKTLYYGEDVNKVTVTTLELEVNSFLGSRVQVQCEADLFGVFRTYSEYVEVTVVEDRPRLALVLDIREATGKLFVTFWT